MKAKVYDFSLQLSWKILSVISRIDRFDASWTSIERLESGNLRQLRHIATIQSVGASTRIEGSKMSDEEVAELLNNIGLSKIEDRDSQEVVGYFNVLDTIVDSFDAIAISESNIKNLHNQLLKYSSKDSWHRGDFKQHVNAVEASFPDGSKKIIFKTTDPGFATEDAMRRLIDWYSMSTEVHPLIVCAAFVYEFVSIHPFQDGNGRLSRLLTTLLLMQKGYKWIQYVSFEHEIENRKKDYYVSLRSCQAQRPNEDITDWIEFFLESLLNVQFKLEQKLALSEQQTHDSTKEKMVYSFIVNHAGCKSSDIVSGLNISKPTVKRILSDLIDKQLIVKYGRGAGVTYIAPES
ncbi:MAG: Fic family protein [Bacteroidota bacterium]